MLDRIKWDQILAQVKTPIGFLGLAVIVVGVLASMGIVWNWPWVVASMIILLFGIVILVGFITFYRPSHWYQQLEHVTGFITSDAFRDAVTDIAHNLIEHRVKGEALQSDKEGGRK